MKNNILVVVAHPDDEALGCGGTIAKHILKGDTVNLIVLSNGEDSRVNKKNLQNKIKLRNYALQNSSKILGINKIFKFDFPDNKFDTIPLLDLIQTIEPLIKKIKPDIIYTHYINDLNIDHQIVALSINTICRPSFIKKMPKKIYSFEILTSTELNYTNLNQFNPNYFVDITKTFKLKIKAIKQYKSEIMNFPNGRSIKGVEVLSNYRGLSCGFKNAEAFVLLKEIS
jgi:LmbE family N-acetylglucosaminyl deacetylase